MELNINDPVEVRLTSFGENVLAIYEADKQELFNREKGKYRLPLWKLMHIFGSCLRHGALEMPFVKNKLEIDKLRKGGIGDDVHIRK